MTTLNRFWWFTGSVSVRVEPVWTGTIPLPNFTAKYCCYFLDLKGRENQCSPLFILALPNLCDLHMRLKSNCSRMGMHRQLLLAEVHGRR